MYPREPKARLPYFAKWHEHLAKSLIGGSLWLTHPARYAGPLAKALEARFMSGTGIKYLPGTFKILEYSSNTAIICPLT